MPIIEAHGLLNGKRLRRCSDLARLYWPYLFSMSNDLGRIEMDFEGIAGEFHSFRNPPCGDDVKSHFLEYAHQHLIFVYVANGVIWGQWDTPKSLLPRHPKKKDRESPSPADEDLSKWKAVYVEQNEEVREVAQNFESLRGNVRGVGVGVGVGKNISPSAAANGVASHSQPRRHATGQPCGPSLFDPSGETNTTPVKTIRRTFVELQDEWFEKEFWPPFWRKTDKPESRRVFRKHAVDEGAKNLIVGAVREQAPEYLKREREHQPYAATWLNKKRYGPGGGEAEEQPKSIQPIEPSPYPKWRGYGEPGGGQ